MERIEADIRKLVSYGIRTGLVPEEDRIFTINKLLELFGLEELENAEQTPEMAEEELEEVLSSMCDYAYGRGLLAENTVTYRDLCYPQLVGTIQLSGGRRHVKKYIWSF